MAAATLEALPLVHNPAQDAVTLLTELDELGHTINIREDRTPAITRGAEVPEPLMARLKDQRHAVISVLLWPRWAKVATGEERGPLSLAELPDFCIVCGTHEDDTPDVRFDAHGNLRCAVHGGH